jgi:hypothetical protein
MKNLLVISIIITSLFNSFGQTKEQEISKADKFSSKAGTLIEKEFIDVGSVNKAKIRVIHYKDFISNDVLSAVRFELEVTSSISTDTKIASLDSDEIEGLIKSIKIMEDNVFNSKPTNYKEVTFKSRGGFESGCFWSKGEWSTYLKLEKFDNKSYVFLKRNEYPELLSLIEKAKSMLK